MFLSIRVVLGIVTFKSLLAFSNHFLKLGKNRLGKYFFFSAHRWRWVLFRDRLGLKINGYFMAKKGAMF